MADHSKMLPRPLFHRNVSWDPFRDWVQPNRMFDQDISLHSFVEPGDLGWIDWARRRLATSSWPGYMRSPLFAPSCLQTPEVSSPGLQRQASGEQAEISAGRGSWKVTLDVSHFSPEEITIKTKEGYLEIAGKHEERQDEHGLVSRSFTRKYKLPTEVDLQHISSSLSGDGLLSVEAPLAAPAATYPAEVVIPIQRKQEQQVEK